ncbi:MAG: Zn-binding domain-containing protein [Thermoanaerobaculia bacterium]
MTTFDQIVFPGGVLMLAGIGGVIADRAAALRRRPGGDRGDFWARLVSRVCLLLALPILASGAFAVFPDLWRSGWHLQFDLTGFRGWPLPFCYRMALLLPFAAWTALLFYGLAERPGDRDTGRWLAGAIGAGGSRLWLLVAAFPLLVILLAARSDLGGGAGAYPGATWGMVAVLLLSLIGAAFSAGADVVEATAPTPRSETAARPLQLWPEALKARGITTRHLATWPASAPPRRVRHTSAHLEARLCRQGANAVAPELIETIEELLAGGVTEESRSRVVFGPDNCGEVEAVALAAELLNQRFHATTLIVTAGDPRPVAAQFARWLPGRRVIPIASPADVETNASVMVADAQMLSDVLLPKFKNPLLVKRFGLVVWWHLEAYTGVLAANLWAISRRLHRLLRATGRPDVRTLAFVRSTAHGDAQTQAFVRSLLPHSLPVTSEVHVEPRMPRPVHLHVLESHETFFKRGEGRNVQERNRHLSLVAAKVSVEEGWPTALELPPDIDDAECAAFLQLPVGDVLLRDALQPDAALAGAEVRKVRESDVLSLVEIVGQGGRAAAHGLPHHVGLSLPTNPYVAHVLSTLTTNGGTFHSSRRLVPAVAHPSVMRRHLLLALDEHPDTWSGLLRNFLWNEDLVRATLEQISREGKLTRKEVRFLDERGELRREHEYKSQRPSAGERRPLDTIGTSLIDVRDPSAGDEADEGVRMRVDPERLTIQAYPNRIFVRNGRRYRIREWSSVQNAIAAGWLACDRDELYSLTWRLHHASVYSIEPTTAPVGIGEQRKLLTRFAASLRYTEEITGSFRLTPDLTGGAAREARHELARPIEQSFATRALVLRFPDAEDEVAVSSLASALRHVLPVHLGIEEDAIAVVPLVDVIVQRRPISGLAIVDLYPRGIGLVDAISDDDAFLLQLLEWTHGWLATCACQSEQGCERCVQSRVALALNGDSAPSRGAALRLLRQVV